MIREVDVLIVGAGVIGASIARSLMTSGRTKSCIVLEKEGGPALHTSGRNSGVIHSGFNPSPGSLKAKLCIEGNRRLKEYCQTHQIPFQECGTLVVASEQKDRNVLEELLRRGQANGVPNIQLINKQKLAELEPHVTGLEALYSPSGAITSGKDVTKSIAHDAQEAGANFYFREKLLSIEESGTKIRVKTTTSEFLCERLINCAGLYADKVAQTMGAGRDVFIVPFRGEYYQTLPNRSTLIKSMVYPAPNLDYPFLGVHWTKTIDGNLIIGPNATMATGRESYSTIDIRFGETLEMAFKPSVWKMFASAQFRSVALEQFQISISKKRFVNEARKLVPSAHINDFVVGKRGNRAQVINREGHLVEDVLIERKGNSLHVLNAISPGFTCALPFADHLAQML